MEWKLDDSRPIWMQLEEQLTRRILSGWGRLKYTESDDRENRDGR